MNVVENAIFCSKLYPNKVGFYWQLFIVISRVLYLKGATHLYTYLQVYIEIAHFTLSKTHIMNAVSYVEVTIIDIMCCISIKIEIKLLSLNSSEKVGSHKRL